MRSVFSWVRKVSSGESEGSEPAMTSSQRLLRSEDSEPLQRAW